MTLTENKKVTGFSVNPYKVDYNSWPLDWLANYVEKKQRKSLTEISKAIRPKLTLMVSLHRSYNSDLLQMEMLLNDSIKQLNDHMKKEETGLFPFIRELILAKELKKGVNQDAFVKIEALILLLNEDHNRESQRMKLISQKNDSCTALGTYSKMHKVLFTGLSDFQEELELHIYLQSKFLFPKIMSMKCDVT
jgi:regulator of cell morphogenesis and NO signaling